MDLVNQVPVLVLDVLEADVSQDTSIVDQDINATKRLDGRLDDLLAVLDRVVVGDGLAARGLDLVDNYISSLRRSATRSKNGHQALGSPLLSYPRP